MTVPMNAGQSCSTTVGLRADAFYPMPSSDGIASLIRIGATWSVGLLLVRQATALATTAILSRALPASDFGVVAMVGTATGFLMLVSDMGLMWATVQRPRIEREEIHLLFWVGAGLGFLAWSLLAVGSPLVAGFYREAQLVPLSIVMGSSLFLNGMAVQPVALLKRQMRQRELAVSQTASVLVAGLVAVVLALAGARYWALAAQTIVGALVLLVMSAVWSGYRPAAPRLSRGAISLLSFGGYTGACNLVTYLQVNLDNILIGRYCGADELGYYARAYFLRGLPALYASMAVTDVMVPALAALAREPERLGAVYRKAMRLAMFVGGLLAILLAVTAPETVRILYGPAWAPVVPLLQWMAFPAFVLPLYTSMGWLFIASGRSRAMFMLSLVTTPIVVFAYLLALPWSALGIAIAGALLFTVPLPWLALQCAHRAAGIRLWDTLRHLVPVFVASVAAGVTGLAAWWACDVMALSAVVALGVKSLAATATYAGIAAPKLWPGSLTRLWHVLSSCLTKVGFAR